MWSPIKLEGETILGCGNIITLTNTMCEIVKQIVSAGYLILF